MCRKPQLGHCRQMESFHDCGFDHGCGVSPIKKGYIKKQYEVQNIEIQNFRMIQTKDKIILINNSIASICLKLIMDENLNFKHTLKMMNYLKTVH